MDLPVLLFVALFHDIIVVVIVVLVSLPRSEGWPHVTQTFSMCSPD